MVASSLTLRARRILRTRPRLTTARPPACNNSGGCSRCRRWTEPEDEFVDELIGKHKPAVIAAKLNERFGLDRTACAVIQRLKRRGKSRWMEDYATWSASSESIIGRSSAAGSSQACLSADDGLVAVPHQGGSSILPTSRRSSAHRFA